MAKPGALEMLLCLAAAAVLLFSVLPAYLVWTLIVGAAIYLYASLRHEFGYWERMGIPGPGTQQKFPLAMFFEANKNMLTFHNDWTDKCGKVFGYHMMNQRCISVTEPELLKRILVKDFDHFVNRFPMQFNKYSLMGKMLSVQVDDKWKALRNTITPAFTSGKMKHMPFYIQQSLDRLEKVIDKQIADEAPVNVKDTFSRYTLDVVASISFALDIEAQTRDDNPFVTHARKIIGISFGDPAVLFSVAMPNVAEQYTHLTGKAVIAHESEAFFKQSIAQIIDNRKQHPLQSRPDFLQLCLNSQKLAAGGQDKDQAEPELDADISFEQTRKVKKAVMTQDELIAQSTLFLAAGFDTTASTLEFCLYELAMHQDVQQQCREEIQRACDGDPSKLTFDQIMHLELVDAVFSEILRLHPVAFHTMRYCNKTIEYPDYNLEITAGTQVGIPIFHIHHDPAIYPEPEKFKPDRFLGANKDDINAFTYLPFGGGPRNCIGMRFAQLELRQTLAHVLCKYTIMPCAQTPAKIEYEVTSLLKPKHPVKVNFERIN